MSELVRFNSVSKKFCKSLKKSMYYSFADSLGTFLGFFKNSHSQLRKEEFWALQDISFSLNSGDILGIVGGNGSGKSTLLRLLTGIYLPECGEISVSGRVGALIAVGAGFHPHMTGRENIYLNATILGLSSKEVSENFEKIEKFSELGDFLNAPVSTYSSGMKVKLGFAIAVHCSPDILLVDEVLSVGDISFRDKCLKKITELKDRVKGVIFISHNIEQVRSLCNRVLVLDNGKNVFDGEVIKGLTLYQEIMARKSLLIERENNKDLVIFNETSKSLKVIECRFNNSANDESGVHIVEASSVSFQIKIQLTELISHLLTNIVIRNSSGINIVWRQVKLDEKDLTSLSAGVYSLSFTLSNIHLEGGAYKIAFGFLNDKNLERYGKYTDIEGLDFLVKGTGISRGIVKSEIDWEIDRI